MTREAEFVGAPLLLERAGVYDSGEWIVFRDFHFYSAVLGALVTVPTGFQTDLASVPRVPLVYDWTGGTGDESAVVHDFLYSSKLCTRREADAVFDEALDTINRARQAARTAAGVPAWRRALATINDAARRRAMWLAVRIGGGAYWKAPTAPETAGGSALLEAP